MSDEYNFPGYKLPVNPAWEQGTVAHGYVTPSQDRIPQVMSIPPQRVLPIVFLPGIMGSNLRMSAERQAQMGRNNNIAWRPDDLSASRTLIKSDEATRQNQLDPTQTEVDIYDPVNNPTGDPKESAAARHYVHAMANSSFYYSDIDTLRRNPLLMDDPLTFKPRKMMNEKARERGWGEIFFTSYRTILELCEHRLNTAFYRGELNSDWKRNIVGVSPAKWHANPQPALQPLDEATLLAAVTKTWFPVHAMGYNWLQSNRDSGVTVAKRIAALIAKYQNDGYQCEKVIIVTHSMGGLVARAVIHPDMGNLHNKVLGIVHGVMPAIGAGAAYKRMRCGFEDPGLGSMSPKTSIVAKVLGNFGTEVTAVLGNAQGGLELLPSQAYGNDWLRVTHGGKTLVSLPKKGDPYEEIYKLRGKWYGLLREDWINPAGHRRSSFERTSILLDKAKAFHNAIVGTYHVQSYAHYGADPGRAAWHRVVWALEEKAKVVDVHNLGIAADNRQGELHVSDPGLILPAGVARPQFTATMQAANDPGDQTVPLHSAEHQLRSGKFKGIFRQLGYEHQNSYSDPGAVYSTIYSLIQIAKTMKWSK
jgi:pimeloyl-ACP methyl ester carboxylesterase